MQKVAIATIRLLSIICYRKGPISTKKISTLITRALGMFMQKVSVLTIHPLIVIFLVLQLLVHSSSKEEKIQDSHLMLHYKRSHPAHLRLYSSLIQSAPIANTQHRKVVRKRRFEPTVPPMAGLPPQSCAHKKDETMSASSFLCAEEEIRTPTPVTGATTSK